MIQLQRASAGSGKTHTLTGKFIWYFITIRDDIDGMPVGKPRLRTQAELADSLSHILAVTFTNKATNEMKSRIVEKLAEMADHQPGKETDYIKDFADDLGVTEKEISDTCRLALSMLLHEYSDFQVSTIDSFFQTVLRTFAYEADLSDTYQVEIDDKLVARTGLDATIAEVNGPTPNREVAYWISKLMDVHYAGGKKDWNIFQKNDRKGSIYYHIREAASKTQSEEFKHIRKELESYFHDYPNWSVTVDQVRSYALSDAIPAFNDTVQNGRKALATLRRVADKRLDSLSGNTTEARLKTQIMAVASLKDIDDKVPSFKALDETTLSSPRFAKKLTEYGIDANEFVELRRDYIVMIESLNRWRALMDTEKVKLWKIYSELMPMLGLIHAVLRNEHDFLTDNNLIVLSDTNSILDRIIGDDDAPFIYERIGTRLNHYLIDEFQDTSAMQWGNLRPLIAESESRGNDNLIIGDAKQSIYRFRNAEPSLITSVVPSMFPDHDPRGISEGDNANWRSSCRIVEFNNSLFKHLAKELDRRYGSEERANRLVFADLYSNIVQKNMKTDDRGYVEIRITDGANDEDRIPLCFNEIPAMICDMLERGYKQRDIAVLVDTKDEGRKVIEILMNYNNSVEAGGEKIDFVSEESLKVADSRAVKAIIAALELLCRGNDPELREGDEALSKGRVSVKEIDSGISFYSARHPEMSRAECVEAYLSDRNAFMWIDELLSDMSSVTLPSLVEAIAGKLTPSMRTTDAPFIAAFIDIVLDYCESYSPDVASFLAWWERKKSDFSIASPENTDAISVMTIHKSKGLQFKCVIVPKVGGEWTAGVYRQEWRWVKPHPTFMENVPAMPPYIPVVTSDNLMSTPYEEIYLKYLDSLRMDLLNKFYVAFTRAVDELYVFIPPARGSGIGKDIIDFVTAPRYEEGQYLLQPGALEMSDDNSTVVCGKKNRAQNEKEKSESPLIETYSSTNARLNIKYKEQNAPYGDDDDPDPRSEGNLMHRIMQMVRTVEDIPHGVADVHARGLVTSSQCKSLIDRLTAAVNAPEIAPWFAPDLTVINERSILSNGHASRPDRIIVTPEGDAVVIDFKFGNSTDSHSRYLKQVRGYVSNLAATGRYRSVEGYLWYVRLGERIKV